MDSEIIEVESVIRAMRGRSQSYLVRGANSRYFVAKFCGNPQGSRTLVNEWIGSRLFERFSISTPQVRILQLSGRIRDQFQLSFSFGDQKTRIEPGLHFGSECPVDPITKTIFDFVPRPLLPQVVNLDDFAKALVIDKWLGNTDFRQAVFVRQQDGARASRIRTYLLDHGMILTATAGD